MPKIEGMQGDVYFDGSNDLPDWRNEPHNDEEEATDEERAAVIAVLGFDPAEMIETESGWRRRTVDDEPEDGEESED